MTHKEQIRLGVARWKAKKRAAGLCPSCGTDPIEPGFSRCIGCRVAEKISAQERRRRKRTLAKT